MPKNNKNNAVAAYVAGEIANNASVCRQFARILGGTIVDSSATACVVARPRPELSPVILGRPYQAAAMFSYQSPDVNGNTLNTGEVMVLQREVNPFIDALRENDILVATVQTHWLFDRPRLISVHFENVGDPLGFAEAVADAFTALTGRAGDDE
ncbi:DUF1259 domain-containing protein [Anaeroselena agilis]|uniref:DUF1259 domain-containing protein n=1 Tax=Anaeroselena agilis TaxID=3063788 RepID=A0ABU3NZX7_9FIRM|nr:DUF1259 domain-containing protein [Selenomonadales bacterium 4137-cl]